MRQEIVDESKITRVNGHLVIEDGGKFFLFTSGVGYWGFYIPTREEAEAMARQVHAPEPKK